MAVVVEMQNTGDSGARAEIALVIEHVLSDRPAADRSLTRSGAWERTSLLLRPHKVEPLPAGRAPVSPSRPWSSATIAQSRVKF
jgi:hypothetical protein